MRRNPGEAQRPTFGRPLGRQKRGCGSRAPANLLFNKQSPYCPPPLGLAYAFMHACTHANCVILCVRASVRILRWSDFCFLFLCMWPSLWGTVIPRGRPTEKTKCVEPWNSRLLAAKPLVFIVSWPFSWWFLMVFWWLLTMVNNHG